MNDIRLAWALGGWLVILLIMWGLGASAVEILGWIVGAPAGWLLASLVEKWMA